MSGDLSNETTSLVKADTCSSTVATSSQTTSAAATGTGSGAEIQLESWVVKYGTRSLNPHSNNDDANTLNGSTHSDSLNESTRHIQLWNGGPSLPSLRWFALNLSLYINIAITIAKLVAYIKTWSLALLAALLDSVLDVVSQGVLNYTERHSSLQRSSAFYPAGASRLEPIGVLTCAALMGMASFEVLKESCEALIYQQKTIVTGGDGDDEEFQADLRSFWGMLVIVLIKIGLLGLCNRGANKKLVRQYSSNESATTLGNQNENASNTVGYEKAAVQLADPTLEALAQDHWNDALSNSVAAIALLFALRDPSLWFLDPVGAILISIYIIFSWYMTGKEQIEQLTGKSAPEDFIDELREIAEDFDPERIVVDVIRAYHFGPKFLVEIEIVMAKDTLLFESHDVGMELQYEIEGREEVERCFVHIDYETRPYDEHVVSKVPELREKYRPSKQRIFGSAQSV